MTIQKFCHAAIAASLVLTIPAWAHAETSAPSIAGFQSLSAGNQKIARALFDAQQPTAAGPAPLNLDQIAKLKATEGWGKVFNQMKAEGLVDAKNLGQVVSSYEHTDNRHLTSSTRNAGAAVLVTTGNGRTITAGSGRSALSETNGRGHGGEVQHADSTMSITTAGGSTTGGSSISGAHGGGAGHGR